MSRHRLPIHLSVARGIQAAGCALLIAACSRSEAKRAEPVPVAVQPPPVAPPAQAEPAPHPSAAPAAGEPARVAKTPIPAEERALFNILERLVKEPGSLAELAPKAKFIDYDEDGKKHPFKDPAAQLGWLFKKPFQLITKATTAYEMSGDSIQCDAVKLSCDASYGGGEADFTFARQGDKIVLTEIMRQPVY